MTTFVFELGCEELPSSALPDLNLQFQQLFTNHLNEALLAHQSLSAIAAPRRLGVVIEGLRKHNQGQAF